MKYYAVIDTNVLISAMLKWDSVPGNVLELVTGNIKHFPSKPFVVTPRQLIDIIVADITD